MLVLVMLVLGMSQLGASAAGRKMLCRMTKAPDANGPSPYHGPARMMPGCWMLQTLNALH